MPAVPDAAIRRRAAATSGPFQVPAGDGWRVYGQSGCEPGMLGGTIWQVGAVDDVPPPNRTISLRSVARLTARRTRTSSNGGSRTLRNMKSVASHGAVAMRLG